MGQPGLISQTYIALERWEIQDQSLVNWWEAL
jgi:hypothetical protein